VGRLAAVSPEGSTGLKPAKRGILLKPLSLIIALTLLLLPATGQCRTPFTVEQVIAPGTVFYEQCELDREASDSFAIAVRDKRFVGGRGMVVSFDLSYNHPTILVKIRLKGSEDDAGKELDFISNSCAKSTDYEIKEMRIRDNRAISLSKKHRIEIIYLQCNNVVTGFLGIYNKGKEQSLLDATTKYSRYLNGQ